MPFVRLQAPGQLDRHSRIAREEASALAIRAVTAAGNPIAQELEPGLLPPGDPVSLRRQPPELHLRVPEVVEEAIPCPGYPGNVLDISITINIPGIHR